MGANGSTDATPAQLHAELVRCLREEIGQDSSVERVRTLLHLGVDIECQAEDIEYLQIQGSSSNRHGTGGAEASTPLSLRASGPPSSPRATGGLRSPTSAALVGPSFARYCVDSANRMRLAGRHEEAGRCAAVAQLLKDRASQLVVAACREGNLPKLKRAVDMGGETFQQSIDNEGGNRMAPNSPSASSASSSASPSSAAAAVSPRRRLSVLEEAIRSPRVTLALVQYLLAAHVGNRAAVLHATELHPPAPLHQTPGLPSDVREYLRLQLSQVLLEVPFSAASGSSAEARDMCLRAKRLVRCGADMHKQDSAGLTVLARSVARQHVSLVQLLLAMGMDADWVQPGTGRGLIALAEEQRPYPTQMVAVLKAHKWNVALQKRIQQVSVELVPLNHCDDEKREEKAQTQVQEEPDFESHAPRFHDTPLDSTELPPKQHRAASAAVSSESESAICARFLVDVQQFLLLGADIHIVNANQDSALAQLVIALCQANKRRRQQQANSGDVHERRMDQMQPDVKLIQAFRNDFHADSERTNLQGLRVAELAVLLDGDMRILSELLSSSKHALLHPRSKESLLSFAERVPRIGPAAPAHRDAAVELIRHHLTRALWKALCRGANRRGKQHAALLAELYELVRLGADVQHPADVYMLNVQLDAAFDGFTPLAFAVVQGEVSLMREMMRTMGADPLIPCKGDKANSAVVGCTPLHLAALHDQLPQVQLLLREARPSLNMRNARGQTPLHCAATAGAIAVVEALLAAGAQVDGAADEPGATPLQEAEAAAQQAAPDAPADSQPPCVKCAAFAKRLAWTAAPTSPRRSLSPISPTAASSPRNSTGFASLGPAAPHSARLSPVQTQRDAAAAARQRQLHHQQHLLVIQCLRRCEEGVKSAGAQAVKGAAAVCSLLESVDPLSVDVCVAGVACPASSIPAPLCAGVEDLDPLGSTLRRARLSSLRPAAGGASPAPSSSGITPVKQLKRACKSGDLRAVQVAVSEGADVRTLFKTESGMRNAFQIATRAAEEAQSREAVLGASAGAFFSSSSPSSSKLGSASSFRDVAAFLSSVATSCAVFALEAGAEGRVASFAPAGAKFDPAMVELAVHHRASVPLLNMILQANKTNTEKLWEAKPQQTDGSSGVHSETVSPSAAKLQSSIDASEWSQSASSHGGLFYVARASGCVELTNFIQSRLTSATHEAVIANDLSQVRARVLAGGLPDLQGVSNVQVALEKGNEELARFLLNAGARLPPQFRAVEDVAKFGWNLSHSMRAFLCARFLARAARVAAATGDLPRLHEVHAQGADLSAHNSYGHTPLSLSLLYTHNPPLVHYLLSRGATLMHQCPSLPSCLRLARDNKLARASDHNALAELVLSALRTALFAAVTRGDISLCTSLAAVGAPLDAVEDSGSGNSLAHNAVLHQGGVLVKWLAERGAPFHLADAHGETPLHLAVLKGDAASVKWMLAHNPGVKSVRNGSGQLPLDYAKSHHFTRIVQLLDPGNLEFVSSDAEMAADGDLDAEQVARDEAQRSAEERGELSRAACRGDLLLLQAFVEETYVSLVHKIDVCQELLAVAEQHAQIEVLQLLRPHYKSLTSQASSEQTSDRLFSVNAEQQRVLLGFLTGLTGIIAGGEVELDVADPATYTQLIQNMSQQIASKRELLLSHVHSPAALTTDATQESSAIGARMDKLEHDLQLMAQQKSEMQKRLQEHQAQLKACESARSKKDCHEEIETCKDQLAMLQSSVELFQRTADSSKRKRVTLEALKAQPNLLTAYRTMENRLESLFLASKSATTGMLQLHMTAQGQTRAQIVDIAAGVSEMVPVIGTALSKVVSVGVGTLVSHLDKQRQANEIANIVTLGSIDELNRTASNTAALCTFYYAAQLNAVARDPVEAGISKVKAQEQDSVVAIADFLVLCMIRALHKGHIVAGIDLSLQLWFSAASQDCFQAKSLKDKLLGTPGDRLVAVRLPSAEQRQPRAEAEAPLPIVTVTIRTLIGTAGVLDHDAQLHLPSAATLLRVEQSKGKGQPFHSICYPAAFTSASQVRLLCERRGLTRCSQEQATAFFAGASLTSDDLVAAAENLGATVPDFVDESSLEEMTLLRADGGGASGSTASPSADVAHTSLRIHSYLSQRGMLVSRSEIGELVHALSAQQHGSLTTAVVAVQEEVNAKHAMYQATSQLMTEQLEAETTRMRTEQEQMTRSIEARVAAQLAEQPALFSQQLAEQAKLQEERLAALMQTAQASLEGKLKEMEERAQQHEKRVTTLLHEASAARESHQREIEDVRQVHRTQLEQHRAASEAQAKAHEAQCASLQEQCAQQLADAKLEYAQATLHAQEALAQTIAIRKEAENSMQQQAAAHDAALATVVAGAAAARLCAEHAAHEAAEAAAAASLQHQQAIATMQASFDTTVKSHSEALASNAAAHARALAEQQTAHMATLAQQREEHMTALTEQSAAHNALMAALRAQFDATAEQAAAAFQEARTEHAAQMAAQVVLAEKASQAASAATLAADQSRHYAASVLAESQRTQSALLLEAASVREAHTASVEAMGARLASEHHTAMQEQSAEHHAQMKALHGKYEEQTTEMHTAASAAMAAAAEQHEQRLALAQQEHRRLMETQQTENADVRRQLQSEHSARMAEQVSAVSAAQSAAEELFQRLQADHTTALATHLAAVSAAQSSAHESRLAAEHARAELERCVESAESVHREMSDQLEAGRAAHLAEMAEMAEKHRAAASAWTSEHARCMSAVEADARDALRAQSEQHAAALAEMGRVHEAQHAAAAETICAEVAQAHAGTLARLQQESAASSASAAASAQSAAAAAEQAALSQALYARESATSAERHRAALQSAAASAAAQQVRLLQVLQEEMQAADAERKAREQAELCRKRIAQMRAEMQMEREAAAATAAGGSGSSNATD